MIDIFALACERLYNAEQRLYHAAVMNASPEAAMEYELSRVELLVAQQDMDRARSVAADLMNHE